MGKRTNGAAKAPGNFNLFESNEIKPPEPPPEIAAEVLGAEAGKTSSTSSAKSSEVICPKCKGKALKTLRPGDHDGNTYYCVGGCCEAGDNYYFTPTVVACLTPEAVTVFEKGQALLVDKGEKWEDDWKGMPEFKQEDLQPYKTIYVHFADRKDMEKFAKLVKQTITLNTRSLWWPEAEIGRIATKKYVKDEEVPF